MDVDDAFEDSSFDEFDTVVTDDDLVESEDEEVIRWRLECLLREGMDAALAPVIANDLSIDLHQAIDLLKQGCDPVTLVGILV